MPNRLWVETYRPESIDDYVFQNEAHKERILAFIEQKSIPHLLFKGHRGTGKTTLAFVLQKELGIVDGDFKVLNASDDNSVDTIRSSVKAFSSTMPLGDFKIVFLDEADYLTQNAQAALRRMMEEYSDTVRFILTCNKPHKIIDEIKSRCQEFEFKEFDKEEMAVHAFMILKKEKVKNRSAEVIQEYVDEAYPDMRKLLQNLEGGIVDGQLQPSLSTDDNARVLGNIVEQLSAGKWLEVRANVVSSIEGGDWEEIYRFLYDNIDQIDGFNFEVEGEVNNWKQAIIIIANHLRFHQQVADPEINFSACMINLSNIVEK
jgi:replication factor C small subunit